MIIMINGPFGVGKTTVANKLLTLLPNSMLYDPEDVGFMLHKLTNGVRKKGENTGNFQDMVLWRSITVEVAAGLQERYGRDLIIPMTLAVPDYYREIRDGLKQVDGLFYHFCLMASFDVLHKRILGRGDLAESWSFHKTERSIIALQSSLYEEHINAGKYDVNSIAKLIIKRVREDALTKNAATPIQ